MMVGVVQPAETIRQSKRAGAEQNGNAIRQPLGEEMDPGFTLMPDVSADIQEFMGGERPGQPRTNSSAETRTH